MAPETAPCIDESRVEKFAGRLFELYTGGMLTYMIDIGHRTGLFEAAAQGPATADALAARTGLQERYVREWAGSLVTGGILEFDPAGRIYSLPVEHAACLTGNGSANLAPMSRVNTLLGTYVPKVAQAFREGGGVAYAEYRPEFTDVMDAIGRGTYDEMLLDGFLPLTGKLLQRLDEGIRVADIGCGTGHCVNLMAGAYPVSRFVGYDIAEDAICKARKEAATLALPNASFEVLDVTEIPTEPPFDAVFAFDAIHDQTDPAAVLRRAHDALTPGGWFVMVDIKAQSHLEDNIGNPLAPLLYTISTLHCMTVSLAQGGLGLGTVWGEQLARQMLADAGFVDIEVHEAPADPMNCVYVCNKAPA